MALLRPCGRIFRSFPNLSVSCQIEYIRGACYIARSQGYVTVGTEMARPNTSIQKFDSLKLGRNLNYDPGVLNIKPVARERLMSLCRSATSGKKINEDLLELLENAAGGKIGSDDSVDLALLHNCNDVFAFLSIEERMKFTSLIWEAVSERSSALSLAHYNALLSIYVENRRPVEPRQFLNTMTVQPNETTYQLLMRAAALNGDVESALHIISTMKNAGYALNEDFFNSLIQAHANNKDIESALSALQTMKEAGIEPSTETLSKIACGYMLIGDIKNMQKILDNGIFCAEQIMELVRHARVAGYGKHMPMLLKYLQTPLKDNDIILFKMIKDFVDSGHPEDALEFINCVVEVKETDMRHPVYATFLTHIVYSNASSEEILKFAERISNDMKYPLALADVGESALATGRRNLALEVFEAMHDQSIPVRPHYYWPLIIRASQTDGEPEIFRIIKHMLCLNVPVDHETLLENIIPHISTADPLITLRKLNDVGVALSKILTPLICHLLFQGRLQEALTLCFKIRTPIDFSHVTRPLVTAYKCSRNVRDCAKMFKFAPPEEYYPDEFLLYLFGKTPKVRDLPVLQNFRRVFKKLEIPLLNYQNDTESENAVIDSEDEEVTPVDPYDALRQPMLHPADMNLEELECHLIELRAKGMNERGVMRRLIQLHCRLRNIDRVEQLKKEFEENGFPWTPGMYSSLVQLYSQEGRAVEALNLYQHIQTNYNSFKFDDFKVLLLATALIKANKINDAIQVLETTRSHGGNRLGQDCWRVLNAVVHSPHSELTSHILDILVSSGYCKKNNAILGPLVREHLLQNDLEAAVHTFKKCVESYNHMPLRRELINALVSSIKNDEATRERSKTLLEQVQSLYVHIHGGSEVNADLAIALARNGMLDALRNLFTKIHVSCGILIKNLKHTPEETKAQVSMALLDATTEKSASDKILLYEYMLSLCNRAGDCERAIETRRKLLADVSVTESNEFRKQFFNLLKEHKVPLPEDFVEKREV